MPPSPPPGPPLLLLLLVFSLCNLQLSPLRSAHAWRNKIILDECGPVVQTVILIWTKFKEQQFFLRIHSLKPRGNIVFFQHIPLPSFTICPFPLSLASLMSFHGLSYSQSVLNRLLSSQEFVTHIAVVPKKKKKFSLLTPSSQLY